MEITFIEARDIPDAWFQCIWEVMEKGREYRIDRGSYAGQTRREFEFVVIKITHPEARPIVPTMPEGSSLPPPTDMEFVTGYLEKLVCADSKAEREDYCYTEDTEILTDSGWKKFKDLDRTEEVATLNPMSNELGFQRPDDYIRFPYKGKIFSFSGKGKRVDFSVNPGHRLFVGVGSTYDECRNSDFKLMRVEDAAPFNFLKFKTDCRWVGTDLDEFVLPPCEYENPRYKAWGEPKHIPMDVWLRFFGIWLAEGDLGRRSDKYSYHVRLSINDEETRKTAKAWCEELGLGVLEYRRFLVISNKQLFYYLDQFGKSHNKYIPPEIKNLPPSRLQVLFEAMMTGDGDKDWHRYTTASKQLAQDFAEICLKLGKCANFRSDNGQSSSGFKNNGVYRVLIRNTYPNPIAENVITTSDYDGTLYCVHVPRHHVVMVRRNNKSLWCGNTYGQFLEPQIPEVIRMYSEEGFGTNQACMAVCDPRCIYLEDPPCLRQIDTRIYADERKLHFIVYFRSWDLWGGFPANLAGIQLLKEYMADEIGQGVMPGETIAVSKGLHLYDMYFEVANLRLGRG